MKAFSLFILFIILLSLCEYSTISCSNNKGNQSIKISNQDSLHMNFLYDRAKALMYSNPDSAILYIDSLLIQATKNGDKSKLAYANKMYGNVFSIKSDYTKCIEYYQLSIKEFKELNDSSNIGRTYMNIGIAFLYPKKYIKVRENFDQAEKYLKGLTDLNGLALLYSNFSQYYFFTDKLDSSMIFIKKAQQIYDQTGNTIYNGDLYGKLAVLYSQMENYSLSVEYYLKAIRFYENQGQNYLVMNSFANLGMQYTNFGQPENALNVLHKAELLNKKIGNNLILSYIYNNKGSAYFLMGNTQMAKIFFEKSLSLTDSLKDNNQKTILLLNLSELYQSLHDSVQAKKYFQEGSLLIGNLNTKELIANSYNKFANYYYNTHDFKKAYQYHKRYDLIKDSIFNIKKFQVIEELKASYESEKKEKELITAKLHLNIQKMTIILLSLCLISLIFGFIFYFINNRRKTIVNIELVKRNKELSELKNRSQRNGNSPIIKVNGDKIYALVEDLKKIMEVEKIYLNPDLTLQLLAERLGTNREYLSQALNNVIGKNFTDYITDFRVEEAKTILTEQSKKKTQLTMIAIANSVGFKNTSTFNPVFKQATGLKPSEYRKAAEKA